MKFDSNVKLTNIYFENAVRLNAAILHEWSHGIIRNIFLYWEDNSAEDILREDISPICAVFTTIYQTISKLLATSWYTNAVLMHVIFRINIPLIE